MAIAAAAQSGVPIKVLGHTPAPQFVRWNDPLENGFSADVPSGWKVSGGTYRFGPLDTRPALEMTSPDGIAVSMGNQRIPPFATPNQMLDMTGYREGTWYPNGAGGRLMVRRYLAGTQFAEDHVRTTVTAGSTELVIRDRRDRPEGA